MWLKKKWAKDLELLKKGAKPSKPWKPQIGSNHTASSRDPKEVVPRSSACYKELWKIKDSSAIKG